MARLSLVLFALFALFSVAFAQNISSSTGMEESSSTGEVLDSSSSVIIVNISSSSGMESSSSSSAAVIDSSSSSSWDVSSTSSYNPYPYVPADWENLDIAENGYVFVISWGNKSTDNLMYGVGSSDGFIVNGQSGRPLRLYAGYNYTFDVDALAAAQGPYISYDAMGANAAGSNISTPILTPGNYTFMVDFASSESTTIVYYASSVSEYAGGAIIVGHQSAAALQASFLVLAASAFVALLFPKW